MGGLPPWMLLRETGVELRVRLTPRAAHNRVAGLYGDRLKLQLTAPPVGGAANLALARYLATAARVAPSAVSVVAGPKNRSKTVLIRSEDPPALAARLAAELAPKES